MSNMIYSVLGQIKITILTYIATFNKLHFMLRISWTISSREGFWRFATHFFFHLTFFRHRELPGTVKNLLLKKSDISYFFILPQICFFKFHARGARHWDCRFSYWISLWIDIVSFWSASQKNREPCSFTCSYCSCIVF